MSSPKSELADSAAEEGEFENGCEDVKDEQYHQHVVVPDTRERLSRAPYARARGENFVVKYKGKCFCEAVKFEICEDPLDASYCHCRDCQRLHGAPYQWAAIFHKDAVHFTKGAEKDLIFYNPHDKATEYKLPCKISCARCHAPIADEGRKMMLMLPSHIEFEMNLLPGPFRATHHMFYGSRVEDVNDDLPKFLGKKRECPYDGEEKGWESIEKLAIWRKENGTS